MARLKRKAKPERECIVDHDPPAGLSPRRRFRHVEDEVGAFLAELTVPKQRVLTRKLIARAERKEILIAEAAKDKKRKVKNTTGIARPGLARMILGNMIRPLARDLAEVEGRPITKVLKLAAR